MNTTVRTGWAQDDGSTALVVVRCRGRRLLSVVEGDPDPVVMVEKGAVMPQALDWTEVTSIACGQHPAGHEVDMTRLTAAVEESRRLRRVNNVNVDSLSKV